MTDKDKGSYESSPPCTSEKESKVRAYFSKEKTIYFQDLRVWGGFG